MNGLLEEEVFMEQPPALKSQIRHWYPSLTRLFMASNKIQGPDLNVSTRL
jgi:hypothetical protein